jgi:hypothetical protein
MSSATLPLSVYVFLVRTATASALFQFFFGVGREGVFPTETSRYHSATDFLKVQAFGQNHYCFAGHVQFLCCLPINQSSLLTTSGNFSYFD